MEELDRITIDPNVCLGQPTIRGMRITVSVILKMLANAHFHPKKNRFGQFLKAFLILLCALRAFVVKMICASSL